jgi:hypothetical protein
MAETLPYDLAAENLKNQNKKVHPPFQIKVEVPFTEDLAPLFENGKATSMLEDRSSDVIMTVGTDDFIPKDARFDSTYQLDKVLLLDEESDDEQEDLQNEDGSLKETYGRRSAHSGDISIEIKPTNWGGQNSEDKMTVTFPDGRVMSCLSFDRAGHSWPAADLFEIANEIREYKKRNIPIDKRTIKNNPGLAQRIYRRFADKLK